MSNKNLLDTLMYLFEKISVESGASPSEPTYTTSDEIEIQLVDAGFDKKEIQRLIHWLESFNLKNQDESQINRLSQSNGFRVYHDQELNKISPEAIGYLLTLEQNGKLSPSVREFIFTQIAALDIAEVSLEHIKWIISMTKLNQEGPEQMLELLVHDLLDEKHHKKHTPILH
ncbi:DUF494 domain-containing protein [Thiotrichales bacterium 19S11-10]|nr:DUF494 domain-containing protein [Thiotrichales bacterium 19S11-10]MCF6807927.1 DUF494 domain-containing protein [Thiotrichales bacterium 19S9-11]MCF6811942.1 DUF494 domain-containing protein [Thiotrichales bacterium 19S9-12]